MSSENTEIEEWYQKHYSDGKRVRLREEWQTSEGSDSAIKRASDKAMAKIEKVLSVVKAHRPESKLEIREFDQMPRDGDGWPTPGRCGWIDVFEIR